MLKFLPRDRPTDGQIKTIPPHLRVFSLSLSLSMTHEFLPVFSFFLQCGGDRRGRDWSPHSHRYRRRDHRILLYFQEEEEKGGGGDG